MTSKEIIEKYFEYANAGKWDAWCDLFSADAIYEEQLAGHIEGRETLRPMMAGFPQAYKLFYQHTAALHRRRQSGGRNIAYFCARHEIP